MFLHKQFVIFAIFSYLVVFSGCARTFRAQKTQINPAFYIRSNEGIPESDQLKIERGDLELINYKLVNYAKFVVISKDRLRFRVKVTHKWKEYANPCDWKSVIIIDGKIYKPEDCDDQPVRQITWMWDVEKRRILARDAFREPTEIENHDRNPGPLQSITVFMGKASLAVYKEGGLISKNTKRVELKMTRGKVTHSFTWELKKPVD